jgi:hypothetical protein
MTEKRNQRELLWFQTGGALNFITAAPHCGESNDSNNTKTMKCTKVLPITEMILNKWLYI